MVMKKINMEAAEGLTDMIMQHAQHQHLGGLEMLQGCVDATGFVLGFWFFADPIVRDQFLEKLDQQMKLAAGYRDEMDAKGTGPSPVNH
jgi:hypothetical protein